MNDYPKQAITTPHGPLVVTFYAGDRIGVRTINESYHYNDGAERIVDPGQPFTIRGVSYKVHGILHPRGSCLRETGKNGARCWKGHALGWDIGAVKHPDTEHPHAVDGAIENFSTLDVSRVDDKNATAFQRTAIEELVLRHVNALVLRATDKLQDGERAKLIGALETAANRYQRVSAEAAEALSQLTTARLDLAAWDANHRSVA